MTEQAAPRIVHVALFTRNPRELAPFYCDVFDMKIVHIRNAVQLWDGRTLLALNPWRGVAEERLRTDEVGEPQAKGFIGSTKTYVHNNRDTMTRILKGFVEGIKFFRENRDYSFKVAAEFIRTKDPEAVGAVLDSPARLQEKVPYVPMKGIEFLLKVEALRNPRAQRFDPAAVVDSSLMQGLEKSGFIDALWKN